MHHAVLRAYAVLAAVSSCCPPVQGRLPTRYSPVRHSEFQNPPKSHLKFLVRLACVKHAASVHPEPGSNSHVKKLISVKLNLANSFIQIESEFTVLKVFNFHWSVLIDSQNLSRFLTVQLSMFFVLLSCDSLIILSNRCSFVKHFFIFLNSVLSSPSCDSLFILSKCFSFVKNFFHNFFNLFSK